MAPDRFVPHAPTSPALVALTRELLLERSDHYSKEQLVAYLDGWTSALELLQKTELVMPGAPAAQRDLVSACVERIRSAQYEALDDGDGL